jgi:tRNA (guanine-N7-)-methyltransferase
MPQPREADRGNADRAELLFDKQTANQPDNRADPSSDNRANNSYVIRDGRFTPAQRRAFTDLWPRYGLIDTLDGDRPVPDLLQAAAFAPHRPLFVDIGFGMGDALAAQAESEPTVDFIGVEVHRPGIGRVMHCAEQLGLVNLKVVRGDAVQVLREGVADGVLAGVQVFFPDPWPKKKHHKRRLINAQTVALIARKLTAGGLLHLATDWLPYAEAMAETVAQVPHFAPVESPPRVTTKYQSRGERLGHTITDLAFRRTGDCRDD